MMTSRDDLLLETDSKSYKLYSKMRWCVNIWFRHSVEYLAVLKGLLITGAWMECYTSTRIPAAVNAEKPLFLHKCLLAGRGGFRRGILKSQGDRDMI